MCSKVEQATIASTHTSGSNSHALRAKDGGGQHSPPEHDVIQACKKGGILMPSVSSVGHSRHPSCPSIRCPCIGSNGISLKWFAPGWPCILKDSKEEKLSGDGSFNDLTSSKDAKQEQRESLEGFPWLSKTEIDSPRSKSPKGRPKSSDRGSIYFEKKGVKDSQEDFITGLFGSPAKEKSESKKRKNIAECKKYFRRREQ